MSILLGVEKLLDLIAPQLLVRRRLRLTVHRAAFLSTDGNANRVLVSAQESVA